MRLVYIFPISFLLLCSPTSKASEALLAKLLEEKNSGKKLGTPEAKSKVANGFLQQQAGKLKRKIDFSKTAQESPTSNEVSDKTLQFDDQIIPQGGSNPKNDLKIKSEDRFSELTQDRAPPSNGVPETTIPQIPSNTSVMDPSQMSSEELMQMMQQAQGREAEVRKQQLLQILEMLKEDFNPTQEKTIQVHSELLEGVKQSLAKTEKPPEVKAAQEVKETVCAYLLTKEALYNQPETSEAFYTLLTPFSKPEAQLRITLERFKSSFDPMVEKTQALHRRLLELLKTNLESSQEDKEAAARFAQDAYDFLQGKMSNNNPETLWPLIESYVNMEEGLKYSIVAEVIESNRLKTASEKFDSRKNEFQSSYEAVKQQVRTKPILVLLDKDPKSFFEKLYPKGTVKNLGVLREQFKAHLQSATLEELQALFVHLFNEWHYTALEGIGSQNGLQDVHDLLLQEIERPTRQILAVDHEKVKGQGLAIRDLKKIDVKSYEAAYQEMATSLQEFVGDQPLLALLVVDYTKMKQRHKGIDFTLFLTHLSDDAIRAIKHKFDKIYEEHQIKLKGDYLTLQTQVSVQCQQRFSENVQPVEGMNQLVLLEELLKLPFESSDNATVVRNILTKSKLELQGPTIPAELLERFLGLDEAVQNLSEQVKTLREQKNKESRQVAKELRGKKKELLVCQAEIAKHQEEYQQKVRVEIPVKREKPPKKKEAQREHPSVFFSDLKQVLAKRKQNE